MTDLVHRSAADLPDDIRTGKRTSVEITTAFVERIRHKNPSLAAIVIDTTDPALREAV